MNGLLSIFVRHNVTNSFVEVGCDRASMIRSSQESHNFHSFNKANYGIRKETLRVIKRLERYYGLLIFWSDKSVHQYSEVSQKKMTPLEKYNYKYDAKAKIFLVHDVENKCPPVEELTGEGWFCKMFQRKVTGIIPGVIRYQIWRAGVNLNHL